MIGLEIHFQLKGKKLFCSCDTEYHYDVSRIKRRLTPTMSELGEMDLAAEYEMERNREFLYNVTDNSCLVECDEDPPHMPNKTALETAMAVALALKCEPMKNIQFMRKVVIDGSNTSGFQRTGIIAMNGYLETSRGKVRISTITLEEDAARKISENNNNVNYSLDRLGIPLIEISTEPDIIDEDHAVETAKKIAYFVMSMENFRGEVDSIRQDVNFSMDHGRVEIKGVSKLSLIKDVIEYETKRQKMLERISRIINDLGGFSYTMPVNIKDKYDWSESSMINNNIKSGKNVYAFVFKNMRGLLKSGEFRFGRELGELMKNLGIGGIIHSDELPGYGLDHYFVSRLYNDLNVNGNDALLIVLSRDDKFFEPLIKRSIKLLNLELDETRAATENGETRFLRPLPGRGRMYPETDIPVIKIDSFDNIYKMIPESMDKSLETLENVYGISRTDSEAIINDNLYKIFKNLVNTYNEPRLISRILLHTVPELKKKYNKNIDEVTIKKILDISKSSGWDRNTIEKAMEIYSSKNIDVNDLINLEELKTLTEDELYKIINDLISNGASEKNIIPRLREKTIRSFNPAMAMRIYKSISGKK
ncbi:Glu-tRNA(Gln) amidotransferase subunit GatE [Picrophilus oshimae]|uniref:Glutamyl-tRNA(Gln) amidotransferase subunit E n=1 Tax=Picrophilus torridus (strain ATCC 700027 / DSM 9790 / JCM 10055 / NBRC 100828 / KAW 2/3) TaxID=1122961 RepID=Q6KZ69_PICTO|nr:Glu-tRNA(Gln) amidotransferase subunit GatE [Picrophilus oshimae]AAT43983.1 glutamyl-tRNA(Gln) amidotransferase subunit B [Picrophilus oshimae DSM 9789]